MENVNLNEQSCKEKVQLAFRQTQILMVSNMKIH